MIRVGVGDPLTAAAIGPALATPAADDLAAELSHYGVTRAGIYADNGPAWVIADRACQRAGVIAVPLPHFFTDTQLAHVVTAVGLDAVLADSTLSRSRAILRGTIPLADHAATRIGLTLYLRHRESAVALPAGCGKVTFTSGSTGAPKGVCLGTAHLDTVANALAGALGGVGGCHLCLLPLSVLLEDVAGVAAGRRLGEVFAPPLAEIGWCGGASVDRQRLTAAIDRYRPATLILLPQLLAVLVDAAAAGWQPPPSLRFCAVGGARVAPELMAHAQALGLPAYEGYGLSECGSVVALNLPGADRPGTAGRPLRHVAIATVNGEIVVHGSSFLGYVGDAEALGPVMTGDLGHLDSEGFLHIDGRRKNLLITALGRNVSPEWIEAELTADGTICQAVVVGDARPWLAALLSVPTDMNDRVVQARIDCVNERLPDYARIARWQRLPAPLDASAGTLTANGRPRRAAIASQFAPLIEALYAPGAFQ